MTPARRNVSPQAWGPRAMRNPKSSTKRYDPNGQNLYTGKQNQEGAAQSGNAIAHSSLTGLTSGDDHTQYAKTGGRTGGQTIIGGTASGNDLTLQSTSNVTKGKIYANGAFKCDSISDGGGLAAGTYTPTRSAEANLDSNVTMLEAQYLRVGNTVTVSGRFTADPTTTLTTTSFEITLPIASNIGAAEDVAGVAAAGGIASMCAAIFGVAANDTAKIQWIATDVTSQTWSYTLTYQVIA